MSQQIKRLLNEEISALFPADWLSAAETHSPLAIADADERWPYLGCCGYLPASWAPDGVARIRPDSLDEAAQKRRLLHLSAHRMEESVRGLLDLERQLYDERRHSEAANPRADPRYAHLHTPPQDAPAQARRRFYEFLPVGMEYLFLGQPPDAPTDVEEDEQAQSFVLGVLAAL